MLLGKLKLSESSGDGQQQFCVIESCNIPQKIELERDQPNLVGPFFGACLGIIVLFP